jgi:hypothetical protein
MEITKYKKENLIPLAYLVLNMTADAYIRKAFKILVQLDYPDLKGLVSTDVIDASSLEFLTEITDEPLRSVGDSVGWLLQTANSLASSHNLDVKSILQNEQLKSEANLLYENIILDHFPVGDMRLTGWPQHNMEFLKTFAMSTVDIPATLCYVLFKGEVKLTMSWCMKYQSRRCLVLNFGRQENSAAIELLQELGRVLDENFRRVFLQEAS